MKSFRGISELPGFKGPSLPAEEELKVLPEPRNASGDISFENPVEKYTSKIPFKNLTGKYLCKLAFDVNFFFESKVRCLNKMSSENPLEKEIISSIKAGLEGYVGKQYGQSKTLIVGRIADVLKRITNIPQFKVEVVEDTLEEKLVRSVLEEDLDPTEFKINIVYDLPVSVDYVEINYQLPDEPVPHHKDEKP